MMERGVQAVSSWTLQRRCVRWFNYICRGQAPQIWTHGYRTVFDAPDIELLLGVVRDWKLTPKLIHFRIDIILKG